MGNQKAKKIGVSSFWLVSSSNRLSLDFDQGPTEKQMDNLLITCVGDSAGKQKSYLYLLLSFVFLLETS